MQRLWRSCQNFHLVNFIRRCFSAQIKWFYHYKLKRCLLTHGQFGSGQFVLDLGCSTGDITFWIKEAYPDLKVIGLDSSQHKIEKARALAIRKGVPATFISFSGYELPFHDGQFDKILLCFPMEKWETHRLQTRLEEINRILKPRGEMLFSAWPALGREASVSPGHDLGDLRVSLHHAGFQSILPLGVHPTVLGDVRLYKAGKRLMVSA